MTSYLNIPDNWAALAAGRDAKMAADEAMALTRAVLADALEAASKGAGNWRAWRRCWARR